MPELVESGSDSETESDDEDDSDGEIDSDQDFLGNTEASLELQAAACFLASLQAGEEKNRPKHKSLFDKWSEKIDKDWRGREEERSDEDCQIQKKKAADKWIENIRMDIESKLKIPNRQFEELSGTLPAVSIAMAGLNALNTPEKRLPFAIPYVKLRLGQKKTTIYTMVDSGASYALINRKVLDRICGSREAAGELMDRTRGQCEDGEPTPHRIGNGVVITDQGAVLLPVMVGECKVAIPFRVFPNLSTDVILGGDILKKWGARYDWGDDTLMLRNLPGYEGTNITVRALFRNRAPVNELNMTANMVLAAIIGGEWSNPKVQPKYPVVMAKTVTIPARTTMAVGVLPKRGMGGLD
jgi:hypothetical protein